MVSESRSAPAPAIELVRLMVAVLSSSRLLLIWRLNGLASIAWKRRCSDVVTKLCSMSLAGEWDRKGGEQTSHSCCKARPNDTADANKVRQISSCELRDAGISYAHGIVVMLFQMEMLRC